MQKKIFLPKVDPFLVSGFLLFSNTSAFLGVIWLFPQIVLSEAAIWAMMAIFSIWILKKLNLISIFLEKLKQNWIIFPFLVFSGFSIIWSVDWQISLYRWLILICTLVAGGYIGLQYGIEKIIKFLSIFGIFILFLSTLFVLLVPKIGVMNYHIIQGAWKGLYWHKNHMGLMATFISLLFLMEIFISWQSNKKHIWFWGILYFFSLLFVYESGSVAAYLITIFLTGLVLAGLVWLRFKEQIHKSHYLIFILLVLIVVFILFLNLNHLFELFNRNTSLTGRIPMWSDLFNTYISKRPIGGYGFNAFWYLPSHQVAMQKAAGYPDPIVISDNGFIDILINTGFIGLILFFIFYLGTWWRSIKYASKAKDIIGIFPVILMAFTLLANISWSVIFENESFFMLLMLSVLFCISVNRFPQNQS